MCGRFTLAIESAESLASVLDAELDTTASGEAADHRPRYNIAPTDRTWIVDDRRHLSRAGWGWGTAVINYRSERLKGKEPVATPCLVPVDGFYEWRGGRGQRQPIWFHRDDRQVFTLAGLYHSTEHGLRFVILTVPANDIVRPVHDRMPAILDDKAGREWLQSAAPELLLPSLLPLQATPVSERVNSVGHDDADLLLPPRQTSLF